MSNSGSVLSTCFLRFLMTFIWDGKNHKMHTVTLSWGGRYTGCVWNSTLRSYLVHENSMWDFFYHAQNLTIKPIVHEMANISGKKKTKTWIRRRHKYPLIQCKNSSDKNIRTANNVERPRLVWCKVNNASVSDSVC